jgi:aspartate aminotransferase
VAFFLLEQAQVASVSGAAFGTPECIRLSYAAADAVLEEAVSRIQKACARLA